MADLAITLQTSAKNPVQGDLELTAINGADEVLLSDDAYYPVGRATMQDLFIRLRFFYGEWFLDPRQGIPYFRYVFVNDPDVGLIESIFRRVIVGTPGIASLSVFTLTFDRKARTIYPFFAGLLTSGQKFTSADFSDFLIEL